MKLLGLRISEEALKRFQILHKKSGLKTNGQTFESLVFSAGQAEESVSERLKSLETKVNTILEWISDPL